MVSAPLATIMGKHLHPEDEHAVADASRALPRPPLALNKKRGPPRPRHVSKPGPAYSQTLLHETLTLRIVNKKLNM